MGEHGLRGEQRGTGGQVLTLCSHLDALGVAPDVAQMKRVAVMAGAWGAAGDFGHARLPRTLRRAVLVPELFVHQGRVEAHP